MARKGANDNTFVTITNHDIYIKLENMETKMNKKFDEVTKRQDYTNGKVKKSTMMAYGALSLTLILLGFLFQHIGSAAK